MPNMRESAPPLNVLILSDGRPGHYNQSLGISEALRRLRDVRTDMISCDSRTILPQRLLRALMAMRSIPVWLESAFAQPLLWQIERSMAWRPDMIVSAGGRTLAINALLARKLDVPNIFSGSLRNLPADRVALNLHIDPGLRGRERTLVALKPSPVSVERKRPRGFPPQEGVLLIGGPTARHPFAEEDWKSLARLIEDSPLKWKVLNSRRTPEPVDKLFRAAARSHYGVDFVDHGSAAADAVSDSLARADAAVVTADSVSMLTEAVCARLPVAAFAARGEARNRDDSYVDLLKQDRRIAQIDRDCSGEGLMLAWGACKPLQDDHITLLAEALMEHREILRL